MLDFNFGDIVSSFRKDFFGSLRTACFLIVFLGVGYAGYHVISTGESLEDFFTSKKELAIIRQTAVNQRELQDVARSNTLIDEILRGVLTEFPSAARTRVAVVHNGIYVSAAQIPILRYDVMWAKANPGFSDGMLTVNNALSLWNDYLPGLLKNQCAMVKSDSLKSMALKSRLQFMNVAYFAACPINNIRGEMLGTLFVSWDDGSKVPTDTTKLFEKMKISAAYIASYLEMRVPR